MRLCTDRDTVTTSPDDVALIRFSIVDSSGTLVPGADSVVRVSVSGGGGSIVALDNGNLQDHEPYQSTNRRAFNGRGLAIIRPAGPGPMRVTATANGLRDATMTIVAR